MAFNKRTWLGRQGTGLNKFSIGGASPVTIVNQPDSVTQVGDALSAGNLNDLEDRIEDAFDDVDTELDTKADEQDVTNLNDALTALDHRLENLEQSKGDYIVSSYKDGSTTPSGKGKWCVVEGVEGVSRVENNIARGAYSRVVAGLIITYDSTTNRITITGTANASGDYTFYSQAQSDYVAGHKYLVVTNCKTSLRLTTSGANSDFTNSTLFTFSSGTVFLGINAVNGTTYNEDFYICIKDLNVYFGGSIPSDADTIAKIQTNYPHLLLPSDYGTRIVDWTGNGVRAEGVNIWNEVWEANGINYSTGLNDDTRTNRIRSKDYISVNPNIQYYFLLSPTETSWLCFYDSAKNFLGRISVTSGSFTPLANSAYMRFETYVGYGNTYLNNVQVAYDDSPAKTTYHPYMTTTLSFPSTSLKSAGSVRDTLELNVEVDGVARRRKTQRISEIDLGADCTWTWQGASTRFASNAISAMKIYPNARTQPFECTKYVAVTDGRGFDEVGDMSVYTGGGNLLYIVDSTLSASDIDSNGKIQKLVGVKLTFELADPVVTLSDPIIDNTLLTESGGRMSTVQTGTIVDGIADLGFITL